jgi:nitrate reductase delta subunit
MTADCDVLALAALLLDYPDDDLGRAALAAAEALPPSRAVRQLVGFTRWYAAQDPDALRESYVATFDQSRRHSLYATYATHGDTRARGAALLGFRELYAGAGFTARADELPDYLPVVLQFAALTDVVSAKRALALARPGVELAARSLLALGSPWAPLLDAVLACLPPADESERQRMDALVAQGPPVELVGSGER